MKLLQVVAKLKIAATKAAVVTKAAAAIVIKAAAIRAAKTKKVKNANAVVYHQHFYLSKLFMK